MKQSGKKTQPNNSTTLDNDDLRLIFNVIDLELEDAAKDDETADNLAYRKRLQGILNKIGVKLKWWRA